MYRAFTANNSLSDLDILDDPVESHNASHHHSIDMAPEDFSCQQNKTVEYVIRFRLSTNRKYQVGDMVRLSKAKRPFKTGYYHVGQKKYSW